MLYTKKGDDGSTYVYDTPKGERVSKSSGLIEALGTCDEVGSFLGLCKVEAAKWNYSVMVGKKPVALQEIVHEVQNDLFTIQAELAGAKERIGKAKLTKLEKHIAALEATLPEIKTFFISGGTELAARFDYARTLAREAERRVVFVHSSGERRVGKNTLAYLNRLSSALYSLARYSNHIYGVGEIAPSYK